MLIAQTSSTMGYSTAGHNSIANVDGASNIIQEANAFSGVTGEFPASTTSANALNMDLNAATKAPYVNKTYKGKPTVGMANINQGVANFENAGVVSSGASASDCFANGSITSEAVSAENGNSSHDAGASAAEPLLEDGSVLAMSAEEDLLWSIVRTNSLDFDAWVALIEETEKATEGNLLKIRRVYDAFLAEFPLCYGYWKKYAKHEATSSTEKAMEVYERVVLGVTYSVDIWLHYFQFAISKYEDPEVIRRESSLFVYLFLCFWVSFAHSFLFLVTLVISFSSLSPFLNIHGTVMPTCKEERWNKRFIYFFIYFVTILFIDCEFLQC